MGTDLLLFLELTDLLLFLELTDLSLFFSKKLKSGLEAGLAGAAFLLPKEKAFFLAAFFGAAALGLTDNLSGLLAAFFGAAALGLILKSSALFTLKDFILFFVSSLLFYSIQVQVSFRNSSVIVEDSTCSTRCL